jgi:hypothetical protein
METRKTVSDLTGSYFILIILKICFLNTTKIHGIIAAKKQTDVRYLAFEI